MSNQYRTPKIRKVNNYIIFFDEVIGQGKFGTVVKAQLASDLLGESKGKVGQQVIRSTVDVSSKVFACKIFDIDHLTDDDIKLIFKEVKINALVNSEFSIR